MIFSVLFLISFVLPANSQSSIEKNCLPDSVYLSLTNDGSWCWFSDPRAVYFEGSHNRIYTSWVSEKGDLVAGCFDVENQKITSHIIHPDFEADDHDNPSVLINDSGIITYFYTHHAEKKPLCMLQSKYPENITEWEPERLLYLNDTTAPKEYSNTYTYANICQLKSENNRLYLFWRGTDFKPIYSFSDDQGKTWSNGKIFILPDRVYKDRRPYVKVSPNNKDKIHFAFTDGHPRDEPTNSIYYACYKNNAFFKANGEKIVNRKELPFEPKQADIVYDATESKEKAWIWDVAEDSCGNPVLVYTKFRNDSNHLYYYARWNGKKWENHFMVNSGNWFPHTPPGAIEREPNYSGGIVLDHENPSIVYLSIKINGVFEIEKWYTIDDGTNWEIKKITCNSSKDNVRPFAVRNAGQNISYQLIWMNIENYIHYTDFKSSLKLDMKNE